MEAFNVRLCAMLLIRVLTIS